MQQYPDTIHCFSRFSRVSLELPMTFEEDAEDAENGLASYTDQASVGDQPGAMVLTKAIQVAGKDSNAFRRLAQESAALHPDAVCTTNELIVDGVPAVTQEQSYDDAELEMKVQRRVLFAQIENLVFLINAMVPLSRAEEYRAAIDHAFETARFVLLPVVERYAGSIAHGGIQASLVFPDDWDVEESAENQVRFFGPPQPEHNDYRPTFSVALGQPEGYGDQWVEQLVVQSRANMAESYDGFALLKEDRFPLSSLVEVHCMEYRWEAEPGLSFSQIQALIPVDMQRMYLINAATLEPLAGTFIPLFYQMLRSLRILGPVP